ncbi:CD151 antigen-like [Montipora foliosa]|uniref:CD151 antigen-like n=1 Tax=Montipora foliosa TaxID=591990 RepID=UPI0035F1F81F
MCGIKCIKTLLFAFNFIFWLAGAAILGVGIWTEIDPGQFYAFLGNTGYSLPAKLLIAAGGFVMIVGFLGCCGAIKESRLLLGLFFACLFLIFAAEAIAGILGFLYRDKVDEEITNQLQDEIQMRYGVTRDASTDQHVDNLQIRLQCCGSLNFTDWEKSKWRQQNPDFKVPLSCCKEGENTTACHREDGFDESKINVEGCLEKLKDFVNNHLTIIGAIAVAIAGIQLIGMIFACCLFCSIEVD